MTLELQFKLKENPLYIKYLRENNIWYKKLTREPKLFDEFVSEMKTNYKLRTTDKIEKIVDTIDLVSNLFNNMI